MDTFELRYLLIRLVKGIKIGVCASDQLDLVKENDFAVISNIQNSNEEGLHWVCFYKTRDMKFVEFFDSIGNDVASYGESFVKFINKFPGVRQCSIQFQSNTSDVCGKYCLWFLFNRRKGISYEKILQLLSKDKTQNDNMIRRFMEKTNFPKFSICNNCEGCNSEDISSYCVQRNDICFNIKQKICK